ncbi:matrixin family metalloprotease [Flavobacterium sp.]|uniref:matrixin family metalloprotease n=1 Tax=Flavobacterium sp. TaxID=239 RepID=UPI003D6BDEE6
MKAFFWLLLIGIFINCTPLAKQEKVVVIQPFGEFSNSEAKLIFKEIEKINPKVVLRKNIPFPTETFYKPRNRYRADSLIKFLGSEIGKDSVIIGLSEKDISTTKVKNKDWGVMGLAFRPGNACVISNFRLSKNNKTEQFHKVALHELGHTQGLPHCKNKTCLMRAAEGGNPTDQEKAFCSSCSDYLKARNLKLVKTALTNI